MRSSFFIAHPVFRYVVCIAFLLSPYPSSIGLYAGQAREPVKNAAEHVEGYLT